MKARKLTKETILNIDTERKGFAPFKVGDTVDISVLVKEGDKERVQSFVGDVISFHKNGISSTFTVRKIASNGVGVERIFPYYSPVLTELKVLKRGRIRRAKLFYVRDRVGKAARIEEKILTKEQKEALKVSANLFSKDK